MTLNDLETCKKKCHLKSNVSAKFGDNLISYSKDIAIFEHTNLLKHPVYSHNMITRHTSYFDKYQNYDVMKSDHQALLFGFGIAPSLRRGISLLFCGIGIKMRSAYIQNASAKSEQI
jgi:hypothetical protein